jgi:hypothetical protein
MITIPTMTPGFRNFGLGLIILIIGLAMALSAGSVALNATTTATTLFALGSAILMAIGPWIFWVVVPIYGKWWPTRKWVFYVSLLGFLPFIILTIPLAFYLTAMADWTTNFH